MSDAQDTDDRDALVIYQDHLDLMTRALLAGDFDTFASRLVYPHYVTSLSHTFTIADIAANRTAFDSLHEALTAEGVTDLIRIALGAEFVAYGVLIGRHESHKMQGGKRLAVPYLNQVRLVREPDGIWRETHSASAVRNKAGRFGIPVPAEDHTEAPDLKVQSERKNP